MKNKTQKQPTKTDLDTPEKFKEYVEQAASPLQARAKHDTAINVLGGYPSWYLPEVRHNGWFARLLAKLGGG
jgi:hypothetical protein